MRSASRRQRLVLLVLVVVSVAFVLVDAHADSGSPASGARTGIASVLAPLQRGGASVFSPVVHLFGGDSGKVARLQRENDQLRSQVRAEQLDGQRAKELAALDLLAGRGQYRIVPAQVIALGAQRGFGWTATLDVGGADGVRTDQTVVAAAGLVGRVTSVTATTCLVLLAVDAESAVGSRLEGSGQLGITDGNGQRDLRLQLLDPSAHLAVGDRLVTGPYGVSTYTAGVPIGAVSKVTGGSGGVVQTAQVRPYVDFTALDVVGVVLTGPRTDPRDSVLPPRPTPTSGGAR